MKFNLNAFFILFTISIFSQNDTIDGQVTKLLKKTKIDTEILQLEFNNYLYHQIENLKDNHEIEILKQKLDSELNNVASCTKYFMYNSEFNLTNKELMLLKNRMKTIARKLFQKNKIFIIELSGGMSPIEGINTEFINNKKVITLMFARDCIIDEFEEKEKEIYSIFNQEMKLLISK